MEVAKRDTGGRVIPGTVKLSKRAEARVTQAEYELYLRIGGSRWLREQLAKEAEKEKRRA